MGVFCPLIVLPWRTDGFNILKDLCPACSAKPPSLYALAHTILLQEVIYIVKAERAHDSDGAEEDDDLVALINDNIEAEISDTGDLEGWLEDPWGPQYISDAAIGISRLWIKQLDAKLENQMWGEGPKEKYLGILAKFESLY